jgi:KaiC/GvpD/RAD55 family RecA-like ATPase
MMLLVGESGSGKSLFTQSIVNQIINNPRKIPLAYFTLEMSLEDVMDRFLSFREGISPDDLGKPDKPERVKGIIERGKERMRKLDHFHIYDPAGMSSSELDRWITQSKEIWADKKVLPPDGYNVAVLDLATMLEDFGDMSPQRMEQVANRLNLLFRKHNTFPILVAQTNENQMRRERRFKKPEDVNYFHISREDIKGGSALFERCRVVASLVRRRELLKRYFRDDIELWESQRDLIEFSTLKNNNGPLFHTNFAFEYDPAYKIIPYNPEIDKKEGE